MTKKRKSISRILVWLCTLALCVTFVSIDTYAASSTLKITGKSEPTNISAGKAFDCKGTITSNFKLTNVTGKITTSSGSVKYQKSVNPSSKKAVYKYNLLGSAIDKNMLFNKLPVGYYKYIISAKDSSGKSLTLINKSFSIVKEASTLKISGNSTLTTLQQGKAWTCNGTISSNYNITQVYGAILKSDGITQVYQNTVKPNKKSYKLANSAIDTALKFNKLSAGTYYYVVDATDASGKKLNVVKNKFTVQGKTPVASTLRISGNSALSSLVQGKPWTCNGTISSNYNITQVYGAILKSDGITQVYRNTVRPNKKSYKLANSAIDTALKFNKLSAGTYYYVVDATDASGKKLNVVKNKFTVEKSGNDCLLSVDYNNLSKVGIQAKKTYTCLAYSLAYCRTILDSKPHTYIEYWRSGYAVPSLASYKHKYFTSQKAALKEVYAQINNGKPCIIYGNECGTGSQHYVTVIGYVNVNDSSNMSLSNLKIYDSISRSGKQVFEGQDVLKSLTSLKRYNSNNKYCVIVSK